MASSVYVRGAFSCHRFLSHSALRPNVSLNFLSIIVIYIQFRSPRHDFHDFLDCELSSPCQGFSQDTTADELRRLFEECGRVANVTKSSSDNFGFVVCPRSCRVFCPPSPFPFLPFIAAPSSSLTYGLRRSSRKRAEL
jgi:hypothetical protein